MKTARAWTAVLILAGTLGFTTADEADGPEQAYQPVDQASAEAITTSR